MTYTHRIVRRDLHFDMQADIPRYWLNGDAHQTRYFDALSLMFPDGERFFIDSVRAFRPEIANDAVLDAAVGGFIGQEAMHRREHLVYNLRLERQGVDAEGLMQIVRDVQDQRARVLPPTAQLALTICLEHFTAMLADHLLRHPGTLKKADSRMAAIWRWHALEETEHKAVAFDVYQRIGGTPFVRWRRRCRAMLWVTMLFTYRTWQFMWRLSENDGTQKDWRGWLRLIRFLFVSPAPITRIGGQWLKWFLPGFHPWQHDNRSLMETARRDYNVMTEA